MFCFLLLCIQKPLLIEVSFYLGGRERPREVLGGSFLSPGPTRDFPISVCCLKAG